MMVFAYTSFLLSLCQELCLGCSVGDLVDGSLFPIFLKKITSLSPYI